MDDTVETLAPVRDEAVRKATGKSWAEWVTELDAAGAETMSHTEIAHMLQESKRVESAWWCQSVTVGYEYAKGRRVRGQAASGKFSLSVSRTIPADPAMLWSLLLAPAGLRCWLGTIDHFEAVKGWPFETDEGVCGAVRGVEPWKRLRLSYQPAAHASQSTLLLTLSGTGDRAILRVDHEKLTDATARQAMKQRWQQALDCLQALTRREHADLA